MRSNKYSLREFAFDTKLKKSTLTKMIKEKQAGEQKLQNVN